MDSHKTLQRKSHISVHQSFRSNGIDQFPCCSLWNYCRPDRSYILCKGDNCIGLERMCRISCLQSPFYSYKHRHRRMKRPWNPKNRIHKLKKISLVNTAEKCIAIPLTVAVREPKVSVGTFIAKSSIKVFQAWAL